MKKIMFPATGFPGGIKTLDYLQQNTMNLLQGVARQHDNYTVLYGMEETSGGTIISAGAFVYNGEIIPFLESPKGTKITISETIENFNFNTDPNNPSSLENFPAYSSKSAQTGTGGIHTFDTDQLKRYLNRRVLAKGVIQDADIFFQEFLGGAVVDVDFPIQTEPFHIQYTLRTEGMVSGVFTHEHMIIDSSMGGFRIAIKGNRYENRTYKIEWQILKA